VGHAWPAHRKKRASPHGRLRSSGRDPQRHHRELPGDQGPTHGRGVRFRLGHRHRGPGPSSGPGDAKGAAPGSGLKRDPGPSGGHLCPGRGLSRPARGHLRGTQVLAPGFGRGRGRKLPGLGHPGLSALHP
jgi:hypothetical protein